MATLSRLRLLNPLRQQTLRQRTLRQFSSILNPNSSTPLSGVEKTRAALSLIKSETNPERIIEICRAAELTPDTHLDCIAFSVAVRKLTELNYLVGVRSFLEDLKKTRPDLKSETFFSRAMILYGHAGMPDDAMRTFKEMEELGITYSTKSLNALLFSCICAKNYDEVRRIFYEFPKKYGIVPNLDTYNTVIKAFSLSGSASSIYSIIAEMDRKRVKPNATSFGHFLAGLYHEGMYDEVGKVLELMKKHGISQEIGTYNIRIQSLCKVKKSSDAKALMDSMVSRGMKPNSDTYTHLIHGFCREGRLEEAKQLFQSMETVGCTPDSDCFYTFIYFLCQSGEFDTAFKVCKVPLSKGWFPKISTMKSLVEGLVSSSKIEEARELITQAQKKFTKNANVWKEMEAALPA